MKITLKKIYYAFILTIFAFNAQAAEVSFSDILTCLETKDCLPHTKSPLKGLTINEYKENNQIYRFVTDNDRLLKAEIFMPVATMSSMNVMKDKISKYFKDHNYIEKNVFFNNDYDVIFEKGYLQVKLKLSLSEENQKYLIIIFEDTKDEGIVTSNKAESYDTINEIIQ
jgi:hypothetical protein